MNFCPNCGAKIATNAKFCTGCGLPLAEATKSTNEESATEDIYSADNNENTSINEATTDEIEELKTEDEYEFEKEELAAAEEYKPAKEENTETGTLSGLENRMLAIDQFLRTRKDYGKMKQRYHPLCGILAIVLSFVCTGIVFFVVAWILFGLCDLDASNWNAIVIILVVFGVIYVFYKMLKWLFDIFVYHLSCYFCRSFINKYADEICVHCRVSMRDIDHFSHDYDCIQNLLTADTSSIKRKSKQESDK